MNRSRIRLVYLLENLQRGGVQLGALLQAPLIDRSRYEVSAWVLRSSGNKTEEAHLAARFTEAGVALQRMDVRDFGDRRGIRALALALARERVGVLNTKSFFANLVGRTAARIAGTPGVVANYHGAYEHRWKPKHIAREKQLIASTDAFLCITWEVADYLTRRLGLPTERVKIIPNGFDFERFSRAPSREECRRALNLPLDVPVISFVGRLTTLKDVPTFLASAAPILREKPNAVFLITGDGEQRKNLENLTQELGLNSVRFLGARDDIPEILRASDCLVLTSVSEGFGRVIVEAFASGTAVVATPTTGALEMTRHEETGLIVPFRDPEAVAQAVLRTLRNPEETRRRTTSAFEEAKRYGLTRWVENTQRLFDEIAEKKSAVMNPPTLSPSLARFRQLHLEASIRLSGLFGGSR